jgi:pimeloyl-ACP methyl ester carboxylesterase
MQDKNYFMKIKLEAYGMNDELGKNWILLRGLARESAHWGDFVPLLQATFPEAQITTLDLPGTGRFYRGKSPSTIQAIAETVREQAFEQGLLDKPATLLALSLGGMVAWEWLQKYPEDSCGAALMSTSFAGLNPFYERLRWQVYAKFFALVIERDLYKRELAIVQLVNNRRELDTQIAKDWEQIQKERPVSLKNMFNQMLAAASYSPSLLKPKQPILLLNAKGDRLVAPACSEAIQKKWNLDLHTHPWAGHDLTVDDGEWVALQLKDWALPDCVQSD